MIQLTDDEITNIISVVEEHLQQISNGNQKITCKVEDLSIVSYHINTQDTLRIDIRRIK